jgi:hypothetical protein
MTQDYVAHHNKQPEEFRNKAREWGDSLEVFDEARKGHGEETGGGTAIFDR